MYVWLDIELGLAILSGESGQSLYEFDRNTRGVKSQF